MPPNKLSYLPLGLVILVVSLTLFLFGCGQSGSANRGGGVPNTAAPGAQVATSPQSQGESRSLTFITGPTGGGQYTIAVGQAQLLSRRANLEVIVQPSSGALVIPDLVASGQGQLANNLAPTLYWAYKGIVEYDKPHSFVRLLQSGHDTYLAFITHEGTGIKDIAGLKGRRVTIDFPTSRLLRELAIAELEAYGLEVGDVRVLKAEFTDKALQDLAEGRTEAVMASLSGAKITELATKVKIRILPFDPGKIGVVQERLPVVYAAETPANFPAGGGIPVVATPTVLYAHESLSEDVVYQIVKALNENYQELLPIHADFKGWSPERAVRPLSIPYHPGAVKYYKEKGLWNSEMEANQLK